MRNIAMMTIKQNKSMSRKVQTNNLSIKAIVHTNNIHKTTINRLKTSDNPLQNYHPSQTTILNILMTITQ
jgi:hypothetical protein